MFISFTCGVVLVVMDDLRDGVESVFFGQIKLSVVADLYLVMLDSSTLSGSKRVNIVTATNIESQIKITYFIVVKDYIFLMLKKS